MIKIHFIKNEIDLLPNAIFVLTFGKIQKEKSRDAFRRFPRLPRHLKTENDKKATSTWLKETRVK